MKRDRRVGTPDAPAFDKKHQEERHGTYLCLVRSGDPTDVGRRSARESRPVSWMLRGPARCAPLQRIASNGARRLPLRAVSRADPPAEDPLRGARTLRVVPPEFPARETA
jgi:hypothetical protein